MASAVLEQENTLKDQVVSKIVNSGQACATDLATQIGEGLTAADLVETLESLVAMGVLRPSVDTSDPRVYNKYQKKYELAR